MKLRRQGNLILGGGCACSFTPMTYEIAYISYLKGNPDKPLELLVFGRNVKKYMKKLGYSRLMYDAEIAEDKIRSAYVALGGEEVAIRGIIQL